MPSTLPTAPMPTMEELTNDIGSSVLHALRAQDPRAYFEKMARLDPHLFYKYVALLSAVQNGKQHPKADNVVNIISAIPRTTLDDLPEGFEPHG